MILKSGTYYSEDNEPQDAEWIYEPGATVQIIHKDCVIVSIDPDDFLAIADAIRGNIMFNETLRNEQERIR